MVLADSHYERNSDYGVPFFYCLEVLIDDPIYIIYNRRRNMLYIFC